MDTFYGYILEIRTKLTSVLEKGPKCEGECSMVNGIKLCTDMLNSAGQDASKEIIFLLGALSTIDPDGPHEALDMVKINNIRCSVVSLSAEGLFIIYEGLCVVGKCSGKNR